MSDLSNVITLASDGAILPPPPPPPADPCDGVPAASPLGQYLGHLAPAVRHTFLVTWANAEGLRLPTTWFPVGTSLLPAGEEKLARLRTEFAALPDLRGAAAVIGAYDALEARRDLALPLAEVDLDPATGGLRRRGYTGDAAPLGYTAAGLNHLASLVRPPAASGGRLEGWGATLAALPPDLRAQAWAWSRDATVAQEPNRTLVLRTRLHSPAAGAPRRVVDCVGSADYAGVGDGAVLAAALEGLPRGAKVRYTRDSDSSTLEILWPFVGREIAVGDALWGGVRLKNSPTKASALVVDRTLGVGVCRNLTIMQAQDDRAHALSRRHVGDPARVVRAVATALRDAGRSLEPLIHAFADAYRTPLPAACHTPAELVGRLVKASEIRGALAPAVLAEWGQVTPAEGGQATLAGAGAALTRAAQRLPMGDAEILQRLAGRLVTVGLDALR